MPPRTCNATRCAHCGAVPPGFALKIHPLTDDALRWFYGQAAHDMGVRSSHGPLVDMALAGVQQSGGRANGAETHMLRTVVYFEEKQEGDKKKLRPDPVGKQRCILARLGHLTQTQHAVLEALYGLGGWARAPELAQVRATIQTALGDLVNVAPMTPHARAHAERRAAHPAPRPKDRPSQRGKAPKLTPSEAARALLRDDPALEGSARGCVIAACCRDDKGALAIIRAEAEALARDARSAACVSAWRPSSRVRGVTHPAGERRAPEPAYAPFDGEDLAGG